MVLAHLHLNMALMRAVLCLKVYYFTFRLTKEGKVAHLRFNPT